MFNAQMELTNS